MQSLYPDHLMIGRYRITLAAVNPVQLADFSAATLRGAFGWSFKRMVCYQPQVTTCQGCLLRGQCPYPQVFEPPPPPGTIYAGQERAVAPYVVRPPAGAQRSFAPGEELVFELILIGRANGLLPYFALALQQLERQGVGRGRGQVRVQRIEALAPGEHGQESVSSDKADGRAVERLDRGAVCLYDAAQPDIIQNHGGFPARAWLSATSPPTQITVNFVSPTRLQTEGQVQGEPSFAVLYRALLRRVSALCTVHTEQMWETDFAGLAGAARAVQTVAASMRLERRQRRSDRQGEMEFWGAEGIMVYQGELAPFWPLLQLGEVIHVGKNCTFGLGQYRILTAAGG